MSQQKVDKYKEQKANRQQIMKKQKRVRRTEIVVVIAIIAAALVWFGISVYNSNKPEVTSNIIYLDSQDVVNYMNDPAGAVEADAGADDTAEEETVEAE